LRLQAPISYYVAALTIKDINGLIGQILTEKAFNLAPRRALTNQFQNTGMEPYSRKLLDVALEVGILKNGHGEIVVVSLNHDLLLTLTVMSTRSAYTTKRDTVILTANNLMQKDLRIIDRPQKWLGCGKPAYKICQNQQDHTEH
jgi:hypothetical protein